MIDAFLVKTQYEFDDILREETPPWLYFSALQMHAFKNP